LCSDKMQLPWREALSWLGCTIFYINRQTRQATRIVRLDKLLQNAKKTVRLWASQPAWKMDFLQAMFPATCWRGQSLRFFYKLGQISNMKYKNFADFLIPGLIFWIVLLSKLFQIGNQNK
jgi:hypothetical protein